MKKTPSFKDKTRCKSNFKNCNHLAAGNQSRLFQNTQKSSGAKTWSYCSCRQKWKDWRRMRGSTQRRKGTSRSNLRRWSSRMQSWPLNSVESWLRSQLSSWRNLTKMKRRHWMSLVKTLLICWASSKLFSRSQTSHRHLWPLPWQAQTRNSSHSGLN